MTTPTDANQTRVGALQMTSGLSHGVGPVPMNEWHVADELVATYARQHIGPGDTVLGRDARDQCEGLPSAR